MSSVGDYVLTGGAGFCNAVRRSLISDLKSESPCEVTMTVNTSCQTDEFIAHRIGLIPFRRTGNGNTMQLKVKSRPALSSDFTGPAFEACAQVEVMNLAEGQELNLTVTFDEQLASTHARYAKCAAVGMQKIDGGGTHRITFTMIDGSSAMHAMLAALDALEHRVNDALHGLADRDLPPPKSFC